MDMIEFELFRYDQWKEDLEKRKQYLENNTGLCVVLNANFENQDKKLKIIEDIWSSELPLDFQEKNSSDKSLVMEQIDIDLLKDDLENSRKKFKNLTKKQEQILKGTY